MGFFDPLGPLKPCAGDWWESEIEGACVAGVPGVGPFTAPLQPVNAWSNLAYLAGGVLTAATFVSPESYIFAGAMTFLCVGSWLYHGWPTIKTAALDHAGMYAVFLTLSTFAVGGSWWVMAIAGGVGAYLFRYAFSHHLQSMMGLFLWICLVATGLRPLVWISLGAFAAAMGAWQLDRRRILTGRWGHGIWHLLTAGAIALMFAAAHIAHP